jgi:hypothetical protein
MQASSTSTPDASWKELAHRSSDGLEVTLYWCPPNGQTNDSIVVCVSDSRFGAYFEIPTEPQLALHVYDHPFAYREFSTIDYEDNRLAA